MQTSTSHLIASYTEAVGANDSEKTEKKDIPGDVPNLDDAVSWHVVSRSLIKRVPFWFPTNTKQFEYLIGKPLIYVYEWTLNTESTINIKNSDFNIRLDCLTY